MSAGSEAGRGGRERELAEMLEEVWQRLARGVADRRAAARHPVLATVGAEGGGEARMLVLRGVDRSGARLELHTDSASGKVADIEAEPRATLLVWDSRARLQIRLRVHVGVRPGSTGEWQRLPKGAREAYGGTPPGTALGAPEEADAVPDPARFAILTAQVREIEALWLGTPHRRARFRAAEDWQGMWVAP
jgi:pyridoxine/pyridoxamine 5'-phosphate oxidase